eukprot:CAMPEP_0174841108 /NCGR_PEP_ID=MMETSP1114-20130205/9096_1 /TAXON_ID=312471 /ORGANISM="Neobodo designis, Strain CCAP 1951/1" /LENGTH=360 /DNA_ID=CAMNT_0016075281 /DNA_START=1 /DNA_END=1080 /DNA_ORIENTATION=-
MDSTTAARVRRRGGRWGVRALRVAMLSVDGDDDGVISGTQLRSAFDKYGVPLTAQQVPASSTWSVDAVMDSVVPPIAQTVFAAIGQSYDHAQRTLLPPGASAKSPLLLRDVCAAVAIDEHPDVVSGAIPTREALFVFFTMWGLPRLSDAVSRELWLQFHAELAAGFVHSADFVALLQRLWGFEIKHAAAAVDLTPPSAAEVRRLFDEIDGNKSGKLSLAEVDLACVRLWPNFNKKPAIIRAFKLADSGGDGALDVQDFARFLRYLPRYVQLHEALVKYDTSRDGYLEEQEFIRGKAAFGFADVPDGQVRTMFREADTNRGGKLTLEELATYLAKRTGDKEMARSTNEFAKAPSIEPRQLK